MKTLGYMMLHYGAPYLRASLEALAPQVDHIVILYTDFPSQGFMAETLCPDSEKELYDIARDFHVTWAKGRWPNEGAHHDAIWSFAEGYDWLIRCDSDEVYPEGMVAELIRQAAATEHKFYRIPFQHFWQSFTHVCRDGQMPMRLIRVTGGEGERYLDSDNWRWAVHHMGYCQPNRYIQYKMEVSGHRPEFRPDWYEEKWLKASLTDVHPVVFDFWNAEPYDAALLPPALKAHRLYPNTPNLGELYDNPG